MTVKEVEELTGMTRANIRFYESRSLITPERGENGYRNYSPQDVTQLQRIKLLRSLRFSLEDIQTIREGKRDLQEALEAQLSYLEQERVQVEHAREICDRLRRDKARYDTLNAEAYLHAFRMQSNCPPEEDVLPRVRAPWRRLFARGLDYALCTLIWEGMLWGMTSISLTEENWGLELIGAMVAMGIMLLVEPLLLHWFGTTPGKAILGLSVSDPEGGRLTYREALKRTGGVLVYGEGLRIPFLDLWRNWVSYKVCQNGGELEWEYGSTLSLRDERGRRILGVVLAYASVMALTAGMVATQYVPPNRGELTVAEFAENFNHIAQRANYAPDFRLDEDGRWIEYGGTIIHLFGEEYETPDFQYTTDPDGRLTAVKLEVQLQDLEGWPPSFSTECSLAVQAFVRAGKGLLGIGDETRQVQQLLRDNVWANCGAQCNGVKVECRYLLEGYRKENSLLVPIEGERQNCAVIFEMQKLN